MKIKPEHYEHIKSAIAPLAPKLAAHREFLVKEGKAKDIEKRLRWDASYAAGLSAWFCREIYPYANDIHIDTALRQVMTDLGINH